MEVIVKWIGIMVMALLILGLTFALFVTIDRMFAYPTLYSGTVTNKAYYDGHSYTSTWTFGKISISKKHQPAPYYYIEVTNGSKHDFWTVTEEEWLQVYIGQPVHRSFFSWAG